VTSPSSFRCLKSLLLAAAGIALAPVVCLSQERPPPLSLGDIAELVRGENSPAQIRRLVAEPAGQAPCISFRVDGTAESTLRVAATNDSTYDHDQLIRVLRTVCYRPVGYSTSRAAVSSLLLPGSGQFYTRRPLAGLLSLSAFGGALAFGFLSQSTTIECLGVANGDRCDGPVLSTAKERPYLLAGVGAAAAVAAISAMDAARGASRANEPISRVAIVQDRGVVHDHRIRLEAPAVLPGRDGVAFEFIRLRF
jgi:TM2 domain-containing membrane protein YozV